MLGLRPTGFDRWPGDTVEGHTKQPKIYSGMHQLKRPAPQCPDRQSGGTRDKRNAHRYSSLPTPLSEIRNAQAWIIWFTSASRGSKGGIKSYFGIRFEMAFRAANTCLLPAAHAECLRSLLLHPIQSQQGCKRNVALDGISKSTPPLVKSRVIFLKCSAMSQASPRVSKLQHNTVRRLI